MGSIHEKVEAAPVIPEINANTGVMQQSDAAMAVTTPIPSKPFDLTGFSDFDFVLMPIRFLWFYLKYV